MSPASDRRALLVLLAGAVVIGCGPILVRSAGCGPAAIGFWRLAFALPFLALLTARERRRGTAGRAGLALMAASGACFAADLACWHYGLHYTSVANATVLSNLTPILVTAVAWFVWKETPRPLFLAGLALAVGGAVVMALAKSGSTAPGANPHLGDAISTFTAVWYGGYFLAIRRMRASMGAYTAMWVTALVALPLLALFALALKETLWPAAALGWAALFGLGLMHVTGQGAITWSLGRLPASLAAVAVLVQPVVAALLGWWLFGEAVGPVQALGGLGVLAGVAVAQASTRGATPPAQGEALA